MTQIINYQEAKRLLLAQVEKLGEDYVYVPPKLEQDDDDYGQTEFCVYFQPDTEAPSCIVGHVIADLGVSYQDLLKWDHTDTKKWLNQYATADSMLNDNGVLLNAPFETTWNARRLFKAVQLHQDSSIPWGQAVSRALREVSDEDTWIEEHGEN